MHCAISLTPTLVLVVLNVLFPAVLLVSLTHPLPYACPLHSLFLVQPDQVFLGSRLHSCTHRDRTLYIFFGAHHEGDFCSGSKVFPLFALVQLTVF